MTMRIHGDKIEFPDGTEQITAYDGSSSGGGGTPTPEDLVWENVTADRVTDTTYTNDNNVPLYVQIDTTKGASGANFAFEIDGNRMGKIGTEASQSSLFIVPAKASYKLIKMVADGTIENWNEAKMPLAIGSGSGSYTPEDMVWEDKSDEREYGTTYTNDYDVPIYVQTYINVDGKGNYIKIEIDGKEHGYIGNGAGGTTDGFNTLHTPLYIVPAGKTYKFTLFGTNLRNTWLEAKMPLAVGAGGSGTPSSFARIVDKKAKTEAGGTSVAGTQSRTLNTIEYDDDNIVTLDGNDVSFTLQAGTYVINYSAPANRVGAHNVHLYDLTDSQFVNTGTTNYSLDNASNTSFGSYSVTLTEPHSYKISHYTEEVKASSGLGNLNPVNDGIFATVDIEKVGTGGASSGGSGGSKIESVSFQAYCSTDAQVFAGDTTAQVAFDVFEWDTNSGFDSATSSYTPNVAGYYQVNASVAQQSESMVRGTTSVWKNDSVAAISSNLSQSGIKTNSTVNSVVYCNGVDDKLYIKFNPAMSGGGSAQIANSPASTYFNVTLLQGTASGGGSSDSYWTESGNDLYYKSPNFDSGLYINSQEDNNINLVGYNGTVPHDMWIRSGGAPNSGLGIQTDGSLQIKGAGNTDVRITAPSGQYATFQVDNAEQRYSMQVRPDEGNAFVIRNETTSQNTMTLGTNGSFRLGIDSDNNSSLGGGAGGGVNSFRNTEARVGLHHFYGGNSGSQVLKSVIYCDNGEYDQISDYRTKKNVKGIESALDKVNKLKPINYTIKSSDRETSGFLAHELQEVLPNSVSGTKDKKTKDGQPDYQMINYSSIIPVLTKAIQELSAKDKVIDALSARLDELEKRVK